MKQVAHVRDDVERCRQNAGGVLVELGIAEGGSAALGLLEARPRRFIAFDLEQHRLAALDEFVEARGFGDVFTAHYGVDQADREVLRRLVTEDLDGEAIDVVFDDASHVLGPTRASFEVLFPLLAPGGTFVIEDWAWAHVGYGLHKPDLQPLSTMVLEMAFVAAGRPDVIADVAIDREWAVVTKGDAQLPLDGSFRIADHYNGRSAEAIAALERPFLPVTS